MSTTKMSASLGALGIQEDDDALGAAANLLWSMGYELRWDLHPGGSVISKFRTRPQSRIEWDEWDAELGKEDLAFLVNMLMNPNE